MDADAPPAYWNVFEVAFSLGEGGGVRVEAVRKDGRGGEGRGKGRGDVLRGEVRKGAQA